MFEKLFPNRELRIVKGKLVQSGTSHIDGQEDKGAQRWVKVNEEVIMRNGTMKWWWFAINTTTWLDIGI